MPRCHPPWCFFAAQDDDALHPDHPKLAFVIGTCCVSRLLSERAALCLFLLTVQPETKTDAVDPEATPKTGALARVSIWAGCIATRLRLSVLPDINSTSSSCFGRSSTFNPSDIKLVP